MKRFSVMLSSIIPMMTAALVLLASYATSSAVAQPADSDRVAVLIGFSQYEFLPKQETVAADVKALQDALTSVCRFAKVTAIGDSQVKELTGQAVLSQIQQAIAAANRQQTEQLVIYVSAHCLRADGGQLYLALPNTKPDTPQLGVELSQVIKTLEQAEAI
ncbi:MAG: caspase family protein, partial [Planctomycetales bacterium]|nr:caspase family protein [Planctomycetales bacterium]